MEELLGISDVKLVQGTWKPIAENLEENGVIILKTFLDKYDYYSKFERFRDFPREKISENPVFRNHSVKLMQTLDKAIQILDKPAELKDALVALGRSHARRKIQIEHFEHLREVLMSILTDTFCISEEEVHAWNQVLDVAYRFIAQGLQGEQ